MSCLLLQLSQELQLGIIESLRSESEDFLRNLSYTCWFYQSLLAPFVFKSITLRNNEKSGERNGSSVFALANTQHSKHVKELHYRGSLTAPNQSGDGVDFSDTEIVMPEAVHTVLSNLQRFPNLQTLSIEFSFDTGWEEYEDDFYMFMDEETAEQAVSAEENEGWRAMMTKTFTALAQNKNPCIKGLEILRLVPKEVSAFSDPAFHDFLGSLEWFKFSLHGDDNGAGWNINTLDGYLAFVSKLDSLFFNHLNNVTSFSLKADDTAPVGLEGMRHSRLALTAGQMPLLKSIHLENVFVCPELIDSLIGHRDILESITLHDCFGGIDGMAENGIHWSVLFTALANAESTQLRQLEILPLDVPYKYRFGSADDEERDEVQEITRLLEEDPKRRLFAYTILDDKYGMVFENDEENRNAFLKGDDQRAYDRLMQIVNANVETWTQQNRNC